MKSSGYPISNQKHSGRCWIFACLNVIRVPFMKKYRIKQFEFSQAHLYFWDKVCILLKRIRLRKQIRKYRLYGFYFN